MFLNYFLKNLEMRWFTSIIRNDCVVEDSMHVEPKKQILLKFWNKYFKIFLKCWIKTKTYRMFICTNGWKYSEQCDSIEMLIANILTKLNKWPKSDILFCIFQVFSPSKKCPRARVRESDIKKEREVTYHSKIPL